MIKQQAVQLRKRIQCNLHGNAIKYKCQTPNCKIPYICSENQCFDEHFHDSDKLTISKFNSTLWQSRFQQAENVINNNLLKVKEENLRKTVDYFNQSLAKIKKKMHKFDEMKTKIFQINAQPINQQQFQSVNDLLSLGSLLDRKMDKLRSKINEDEVLFNDSPSQDAILEESPQVQEVAQIEPIIPDIQQDVAGNQQANQGQFNVQEQVEPIQNGLVEKNMEINEKRDVVGQNNDSFDELFKKSLKKPQDYQQNQHLSTFLSSNITNFDWNYSNVLFSLHQPAMSCVQFHQRLKDKQNLLFLFLGQDFIIGSYYHQPYPSIAQRFKKDTQSFIFIQDNQLQQNFALFRADPLSESHISVSEKLLICQGNTPNNGDGLRTFQRTFDSVVYFLPSRSYYDSIEGRTVTYNGLLKIRECYVLQLQLNDN